MGKKIMAVYDQDPFYAERFADYVNRREKTPFCVMAFTSPERLKEYAKEHELLLLLVHEGLGKEEIEAIQAVQTVVLSDGELAGETKFPSVYKYQATDSIIREVMAHYGKQAGEEERLAVTGRTGIIGVYSPVGRCLKTSFALTLGQTMGKERKVLYVSLEDCSGFSELMQVQYGGDLSDAIYYFRQGNLTSIRLSSVIYSCGSLDYIPPVRYPEDLGGLSPEEAAGLLKAIAGESSYDTMIADLGNMGRCAAEVLELCEAVYMPVRDDRISSAKMEEFMGYLEISGRAALRERIRILHLPQKLNTERGGNYMEQLLWGELGDFVRQMLRGPQEGVR